MWIPRERWRTDKIQKLPRARGAVFGINGNGHKIPAVGLGQTAGRSRAYLLYHESILGRRKWAPLCGIYIAVIIIRTGLIQGKKLDGQCFLEDSHVALNVVLRVRMTFFIRKSLGHGAQTISQKFRRYIPLDGQKPHCMVKHHKLCRVYRIRHKLRCLCSLCELVARKEHPFKRYRAGALQPSNHVA